MRLSTHYRRAAALFTTMSALAVAGCGDDGIDPEPEPEIETIQVIVTNTSGNQTVNVPATGTQPTPIPLRANQDNAVSFRFLGANGNDEPLIAARRGDYELQMENLAAGWTFTPTGGTGATFTSTIRPNAAGTFNPRLILFNDDHGHEEVERLITITVTQ